MKDGTRAYAYGVSLVFVALVLAPAFRDADADGYPLSTYPMFAHARPRVNDVTGAMAVFADGRRVTLPPSFVANSEAMLAVATLQHAVDAGPAASRALCTRIAARVAQTGDATLRAATRVVIATQRVDAIDFLAGRVASDAPLGRVHARCKVPGAAR